MKRTFKKVKPTYGKEKKYKENFKPNSKKKNWTEIYSPFNDSKEYHESFC